MNANGMLQMKISKNKHLKKIDSPPESVLMLSNILGCNSNPNDMKAIIENKI
jgi:hypothetical protein